MSPTLGILVNPRSGGDIRRAVAAAGRSTIEDKISIIRRIVLGARAVGVTDIAVNHDPHQIVRRATETLTGVELHTVVRELGFTEDDSTRILPPLRVRSRSTPARPCRCPWTSSKRATAPTGEFQTSFGGSIGKALAQRFALRPLKPAAR